MSRRGITTVESALIVLLIITLIVSSINLAYITGLVGVPAKVEELSGTTADLAAAEAALADSLADVTETVGGLATTLAGLATTLEGLGVEVAGYAETIAALEDTIADLEDTTGTLKDRIAAIEEALKPPKEKFKIGCAISLTGKFAANGKALVNAYEFWADNVNERGGIEAADGKRYLVKFVYYDDKSDPATTAKLVEKLITEDKVDLIFGPFSSACVGPSSAICEKYHVIMIEAAGNANTLFERDFKYLFCTLKKADELGDAYMRELARVGVETVAIIAPDSPFYVSAAKGFKDYAPKYGIEVVHYEVFPVETTDLTPILTKLKTLNPDAVGMGSHTVPAMMLMKQAKEMDFNPKAYFFSFGTMLPSFVEELGKDAEYVMEYSAIAETAPFEDPYFGTAEELVTAFYIKYGMYPDSTISASISGGLAIEAAVKASGVIPPIDTDEERVKLRDALAEVDIMTAAQPLKFHENGWNIANPLGIVQIQNGKPVCIGPPEWAAAEMVYPCPPWKERP